jgi:hypothetical protein
VVAAALTVSRAPRPGFAGDEPVVASLLIKPQDVPGAIAFGHQLYRPSQVADNPSLYPPAPVLRAERACALLEGPTDPRDLTALAVNGYSAQYEMVVEAAAYVDDAPVDADAAALSGRDLVPCVRRLMVLLLQGNGLRGDAVAVPVSLGEKTGDVRSVAVKAYWQVSSPDPTAQFATDTIEFVVLLHGRAEVVILAQDDQGPVPQTLVDRLAGRLAAQLEARFPG